MARIFINPKSIARLAAIQIFYQFEYQIDDIEGLQHKIIDLYQDPDLIDDYNSQNNKEYGQEEDNYHLKLHKNFLTTLVKVTHSNLTDIDKIIEYYLRKSTLATLPILLFNTLRVAIAELKYFPATSRKVIINEYTNIASSILELSEIGFVNSMLDKYSTELLTQDC